MSTKAATPIAIKAAAMTNVVESGECVLSHNDLCLGKLVPPGTQLQHEADVAPDPQSEHGYVQHHQSEAKITRSGCRLIVSLRPIAGDTEN